MRILLLEDHFAVRQELTELIENMGHTALSVSDANEAIALLKKEQADVVITDVFVRRDGEYLPEGGVRLIGAIRFSQSLKLKIAKDVPILVISGGRQIKGGYSPLRTARDLGADFCMQKPVSMEEVAVWIMDTEIAITSDVRH